jgi:hypothetical protein
MAALADFQLAFASAIDRNGGRARGGRADRLEAQPGFAVYRNITPEGLIGALRGNYPVTGEIVGDEAFDALAFDYARRHPPADPILLKYGERFADFLATQPWIDELPYLPDVARVERQWTEAHLAADADALDQADLASIGADGWMALRLPLHPATRVAWLRTPAMTIWQAHRAEGGFETLAPEWRAEGALFTRPGDEVRALPIDAPAHRVLAGLRIGETFGAAAAAATRLYPEADVAALLTLFVASGALAKPRQLERN